MIRCAEVRAIMAEVAARANLPPPPMGNEGRIPEPVAMIKRGAVLALDGLGVKGTAIAGFLGLHHTTVYHHLRRLTGRAPRAKPHKEDAAAWAADEFLRVMESRRRPNTLLKPRVDKSVNNQPGRR